ncbi:MAG: DUF2490 domain-containing protein [Gemmatimonadales bacterium]|nr:DUF2490 domain-containing protein [Gemmatimonadales bacterium]MDZ4390581.1 DUF2490 domain-containing protein [Gemmatimonadales bacterium]
MANRQSTFLALASTALMIAAPITAAAQRQDVQAWSLLTANISLTDDARWFLYLETQARLGDDASRLERLLLRPALGRQLSDDVAVSLGYGWTPTFMNSSLESDFRSEHRIWQQAVIRHGGGRVSWQHRVRQEQRIIDQTSGTSHRTRHLVRASTTPRRGRVGATAYHELFITWNSVDGGPKAGYDRSRVFVGPFLTRDHVRYEAGYVGEYGRRFGNSDRIIHALLVSVNLTL